jgi:hypothetical protein
MPKFNSVVFGRWLINAGVAGLVTSVVLNFTPYANIDAGTIPAISIVLIIIGMCFNFPTLLEDSAGGISSMRVMVLSVVLVFVLVYVKIGWTAGSFEEFTIDRTWVYILGIAFGSKAIQKFGEDKPKNPEPEEIEDKKIK